MSRTAATKELNIKSLLKLFGHDTSEEGYAETPRRFIKYMSEFHQPFDVNEILKDGFESPNVGTPQMIVQNNIPFRAMCMHHLLPFIGTCAIGYVPSKRVLGLSKFSRLVKVVGTEKPSIQEAITNRIADLLDQHLEPKGVIVVIKAEHTCMSARGAAVQNVDTTTSAIRGIFRDVPQAREEFFSLLKI